MVFQAAGAEPSGLDLVTPSAAEGLWAVLGLLLLLVVAAGVVIVVVALVKGARSSRSSVVQEQRLNDLAQRVRALEEEAQRQKVE